MTCSGLKPGNAPISEAAGDPRVPEVLSWEGGGTRGAQPTAEGGGDGKEDGLGLDAGTQPRGTAEERAAAEPSTRSERKGSAGPKRGVQSAVPLRTSPRKAARLSLVSSPSKGSAEQDAAAEVNEMADLMQNGMLATIFLLAKVISYIVGMHK
jgi:hypothetical protein